ncbi:ECF RNA polymerase sigma-E factor [Planctomycetes bacterium Pan216]|uniref:ECF RNA polymerase sigma-E factor n=1 Tax=Kolteria novifilia TaxID=2527975 RepID=A0A518B507_9BACT|nr:ECF RNA polymerase sigma-E factor [Planctomycetes bacterium Pan216]
MKERDQTLIDECLAGRSEAFGELIQPYQDRLYNMLFRVVGREEDAAEYFQEAMVRAFRALRQYQGGSAFYTWLYRIAINVVFTDQRRRRPRATASNTSLLSYDLPDPNESNRPSAGIEVREKRKLVQQALADIPESFRAILVLKDIEGLRYEEIAEVLDIPIGTVRSRLHRARSEMRDRLKPMLERGSL